jgi:hypothetical protein
MSLLITEEDKEILSEFKTEVENEVETLVDKLFETK